MKVYLHLSSGTDGQYHLDPVAIYASLEGVKAAIEAACLRDYQVPADSIRWESDETYALKARSLGTNRWGRPDDYGEYAEAYEVKP